MAQRVLVVNRTYMAAGLELLHNNGIETKVLPFMDHDEESLPEIKKNLGDYDGLIWNTKHNLTTEILDLAGPKLRAISTVSSGLDHIDLAEVKRRGIPLGHALGAVNEAVADVAVGSLIAGARKFKEGVRMVENGNWKFGVQWLLGLDIAGTTVGIIGFGGIGQAVARRLKGFSVARFLYSGRSDKPEAAAFNASRVPLEQLLRESDYVILACPLTKETKHLINKDSLALMKKTAVLVNVARGEVIDQDALCDALKENRIFGAALDVATPEPLPKEHPLVKLDNCSVEFNATRAPLDQLLRESDYVILACPLTKETKHLINKDSLALMKKTAVLVNIARGELIDQDALCDALQESRIFGAALDVTTPEPIPKNHPLVKLDNCYIVPHVGTATFRTRNEIACVTANNILLGLQGKPMQCPVKF